TWYFDDILISAKTFDEMIDQLRKVFDALHEANLTIRLSKCRFGMSSVTYLGFEVSEDGLRPGREKVDAVVNFKEPTNVHELRRFLGLSSYFRRFIPNYARISEPLSCLLKKHAVFKWSERQQTSFDALKQLLVTEPVLQL